MKLDLLKEHYFYELTRKNELEGALSLPVACFIAISGVVFTMGTTFSYENDTLSKAFCVLLGLVIVMLAIVFIYAIKAYLNPKYGLTPAPSDLLNHLALLREYYEKPGREPTAAEIDFEKGLIENYAEATTTNKKNNDQRAEYLFKTKVSLVFSVLALFLCAVPFAIKLKLHKPEPQKIQIVANCIANEGGNMPDQSNTNQGGETGSQTNPEPAPAPAPQSPPSVDTVTPPPQMPANTTTRTEIPFRPTRPSDGFLKKVQMSRAVVRRRQGMPEIKSKDKDSAPKNDGVQKIEQVPPEKPPKEKPKFPENTASYGEGENPDSFTVDFDW